MQQFSAARFASIYVNGHQDSGAEEISINHFLPFPLEGLSEASVPIQVPENVEHPLLKRLKAIAKQQEKSKRG